MREVTLVLPYYINAGMLARQYASLRALPADLRQFLSVIVVDDGSPRNPAFVEDIGARLALYRILVDIRWNQDAARNVGVRHVETKWILLTDIDHLVPEATMRRLVTGKMDKNRVYRFSRATLVREPDVLAPYKPHPNSWFMTRKMYERAGGYDERFAGYYGTDADFRDRLRPLATTIDILPELLIRVPREVIPDASTTAYARKQPEDADMIPRIRAQRDGIMNWRPVRYRFPYERVA